MATINKACPSETCTGECAFDIECEQNDAGDGVWFQSWLLFFSTYNPEESAHDKTCNLTPEQIITLTEEVDKDLHEDTPGYEEED